MQQMFLVNNTEFLSLQKYGSMKALHNNVVSVSQCCLNYFISFILQGNKLSLRCDISKITAISMLHFHFFVAVYFAAEIKYYFHLASFMISPPSGLIQELMKRETQSNVSEIIEKLFSEIENMNQKSRNESQQDQVKMRKGTVV